MNKKCVTKDVEAAFVWIPGHGINEAASLRLRQRYLRPWQPMGEAWFMGEEREMYHDLLQREATELSILDVDRYLFDILSGIRCFGTLDFEPRHQWENWFLYFVAQLSSPEHVNSVEGRGWAFTSTLISGLMMFYPDADDLWTRDAPFVRDILATLGQVLMQPCFWSNGEIKIRHKTHKTSDVHFMSHDYYKTNDLFSAVMFFCWKYLRAEQIEPWLRSVFKIESAHFRAQLLTWLLGADSFFDGKVTQPAQLKKQQWNHDQFYTDIRWEESENLDGFYEGYPQRPEPDAFLKHENIVALNNTVARLVTSDLFFIWLDSFAHFDYLQSDLLDLLDQFFEKYIV